MNGNNISLPAVGTDYSDFWGRFLDCPHLLIAGASGSGKSVFVNGLIYTAIRERFPFCNIDRGAKFIFLDAKQVEFLRWEQTPHSGYYARETSDMVTALEIGLTLCRKRQEKMRKQYEDAVAAGNVVDIMEYTGADVYIVIDEFSDLILRRDSNGKPLKNKVISLVQSIAQIGRSAKVHLWLCTQSPIAKVLPTEIKCNFTDVIGLHTRSANESRIIIDAKGLEDLPRYGSCIYSSPNGEELLQGIPMVTPDDKIAVVNHWMEERQKWEMYL